MALETATYINGLVASNPAGTDLVSQADDHLRLIKSTVLATFPNITGPVTCTQGDLNTLASGAGVTLTGTQTLTNKTLTAPAISAGVHTGINTFGAGGATFDATGQLGIGRSPLAKLDVKTTDSSLIGFIGGTTVGVRFGAGSSAIIESVDSATGATTFKPFYLGGSTLDLQTGGTARIKLDASGNVGIGPSAPSYEFDIAQAKAGGSLVKRVYNSSTGASVTAQSLLQTGTAGRSLSTKLDDTGAYWQMLSGSTTPTGYIDVDTLNLRTTAGVQRLVSASGVQVGTPTGGDKGVGTINVSSGLYVNNVAVGGVTGTAVATTSGTAIDVTGIPAGIKQLTIMFYQVSTNSISPLALQIGDSGGVRFAGYFQNSIYAGTNYSAQSTSFGLTTATNAAAYSWHGTLTLTHMGSNLWAASWTMANDPAVSNVVVVGTGTKSLGAAVLDRFRLTTVSGSDTFDAGLMGYYYQ